MSDDTHATDYMVNLNNVDDNNLIPDGTYEGHIVEVEFKLSKATGNRMWVIRIMLDDGEYAGRYLRHIVMLEGPGLVMGKRSIKQFAPELIVKGEFNATKIAEEGELENRSVKVEVGNEIYKGEKQNRVKKLMVSTDEENVGW